MSHADWISVYMKLCFWLAAIGVIARVACLGWCDYPRKTTYSRGEDAVYVVISVPMTIFVWWLVWGGK